MYVYILKRRKKVIIKQQVKEQQLSATKNIYVYMIVELLWSIDRRGPTVIPNCYFENNAVTL